MYMYIQKYLGAIVCGVASNIARSWLSYVFTDHYSHLKIYNTLLTTSYTYILHS